MISYLLFLISILAPSLSTFKPFTTSIIKGDLVTYPSFILVNNLPIGSYYDKRNRDIKFFECFDSTCATNKVLSIENSSDPKYEKTSIGIDREKRVYIGFFNQAKGSLELGILFPNRTTIILQTFFPQMNL